MSLESDLADFAVDQLQVLGKGEKWRGQKYVEKCMVIWKEKYGEKVCQRVQQLIKKHAAKNNR